jgi:hypothetical protein
MSPTLRSAVVLVSLLFAPYSSNAQSGISAADVKGFEGTWALDVARSPGTAPETRVITASSDSVRIEVQRAQDDRPPVLVYRLDGRDTVSPYGAGTATSRLRREGQNVVTETVFTIREQPMTLSEVLHLNPEGNEMIVDAMLRVEHGYQGSQPTPESKPPNISKATNVFRRNPPQQAR